MLVWGIIALIITVADQLSKYIVVQSIGESETVSFINNIFEFVYVKNTGAAFSIFHSATAVLAIISVLFCIGVVVYFLKNKPDSRLLCAAMSLMFAGAAGNAIDRITRGYVVDFIKTIFIDFPVFNIADIAITTGAALLIVYLLFFDKEDKNEEGSFDSSRRE
ncbi:MAG: signal peptidase II [Clostridia bacterium]|nr:signal peptidase II [Clostridia bacterium]